MYIFMLITRICFSGEMLQLHYSPVSGPEMSEYSNLQPVVHPAFIGITSNDHADSLITGFKDCADEAIRYLVEIEHLSPDDPLVVGLREHLKEQHRLYSLQQMLIHCNLMFNNNHYEESDVSNTNQSHYHCHDSVVSLEQEVSRKSALSEDSIENKIKDSHTMETESDLHNGNSNSLDMVAITSLAEEIMSLLEEDETLSDIEDEDYWVEQ